MHNIRFGISLPLTGNYSVQGKECFKGISLWVSDVNKEGGIYIREYGEKIPLELFYLDDESSVDACRTNTESLIGKKVDILLGPYSSSHALASAEVAEEHGITLWNHGGSTDDMEDRRFTYLVNAISPTRNYSSGIIELVKRADQSASRIAAFSASNSGFSRNVVRGLREHAMKKGFELREFQFDSGEQDFSQLLDMAGEYKPDLICGMGRAHDDILLAGQMIEKGLRPKAAAFIAASIKLFRDTFADRAEGFLSGSQWERGIKAQPDVGPSAEVFSSRFVAAYGVSPDYVAAQTYNIGVIIRECIEAAGTLHDETLRETARKLDIVTLYGRFKTDTKGNQIGHKMVTVQWQSGEKVIVYPADLSTGEFIYPAKFRY